ncbi:MAG: TetR/AcrR family transcriptional regulator [Mycobacterium sp.]|nr:TetR/AcrR family transcriptional regulator [Mycobacterium sp.]
MTLGTRGRAGTRDALLEAVQEFLLDPGPSPISVPQVVARAGVAQGTFYNYFDSLPAAIEAVGKLLLAEHFRTLLRVIDGADDAAEVVARSDLQTLMLFAHRHDVGCLVFDSGEPIDRLILFRDARSQLLANLQWGVATGAFAAGNLQAAASIHIGAMVGASLDVYRGRLSVDDGPEVIARLLRDLGVEPSRSERLAHRPQEFEPWAPLPLHSEQDN